jgi:hypothetical protein
VGGASTVDLTAPAGGPPTGIRDRIGADNDGRGSRHVGVLEFSAPEGVVIVPLWIM